MDITDPMMVEVALQEVRPWAVVNATGYARVNDAEHEVEACRLANVEGPTVLATACARYGVPLLTYSSDLVFNGAQDNRPYLESDVVSPLNSLGRSKVEMEERVLKVLPTALVVRTGAFFGLWDERNFVATALRALREKGSFVTIDDAVISAAYLPDLVHVSLDLLIDGENGLWHLANRGSLSWAELARRAAAMHGLDPSGVEGLPLSDFGWHASLPRFCAIDSERAWLMPSLDNALERFRAEV
jgi:dTDP-4-dehydrorhamnose reductase